MGLLLISIAVGIIVFSIVMVIVKHYDGHLLWLFLLIPPIMVGIIWNPLPSVKDYKYVAEIHMPTSEDGVLTKIYFNNFSQDGDQVTIEKFIRTGYIHWLDFDNTEQSLKPVIITLKDNNGNFIYTDRLNNVTFNDNIIATQP